MELQLLGIIWEFFFGGGGATWEDLQEHVRARQDVVYFLETRVQETYLIRADRLI